MKLHGKTQIFISPKDIQMLTRAAHTDVVVNLASDIARGLSLNEDLVIAILKAMILDILLLAMLGKKN